MSYKQKAPNKMSYKQNAPTKMSYKQKAPDTKVVHVFYFIKVFLH